MRKRRIITMAIGILLCVSALLTSCLNAFAAGKSVGAYKLNTYDNRGSDAANFYNHVKGYDSAYTGHYKEWGDVQSSHFSNKTQTIKYWSSHGTKQGRVYGDNIPNSNAEHTIYDGFKFSGGNLEFVFLCACYQLTGEGSNPRAKYAKSMTGNKAVRVICGYHEKAPRLADTLVESYFFNNPAQGSNDVYDGESVKSSWMKANIRAYSVDGYTNPKDFLVLTHNNNSQYSRFEGFPGATYSRPNSSTSILRFSWANQGGVSQPYTKSGSESPSEETAILKGMEIPTVALQMERIGVVRRDDIGGEIGHSPIRLTVEEAVQNANDLLVDANQVLSVNADVTKKEKNTPVVSEIVMAEVLDDSSKEIESTVAYVVDYSNRYKGVKIAGDTFTTIVDDAGIKYCIFDWHKVIDVVDIRERDKATVSYDEAYSMLQEMTGVDARKMTKSDAEYRTTLLSANLEYVDLEKSGLYRPMWVFEMSDSAKYYIDCNNGWSVSK